MLSLLNHLVFNMVARSKVAPDVLTLTTWEVIPLLEARAPEDLHHAEYDHGPDPWEPLQSKRMMMKHDANLHVWCCK